MKKKFIHPMNQLGAAMADHRPAARLHYQPRAQFDSYGLEDVLPVLKRGQVVAAGNTISSSLLTDWLQRPAVVTKLQNCFAPFSAFSVAFDPNEYMPLAKNVIKFVQGGTVTMTAPTDFTADSGSTIDAAEVSVTNYHQVWHVTNQEIQNGPKIEDLLLANARELAKTLAGVLCSTMTASNFPAAPVVAASANFGLSDAATAYGQLSATADKALILHPQWYARLSHQAAFADGVRYGWKNGIHQQSGGWDSADPNVIGFAASPPAIAIVTGLLAEPPIPTRLLKRALIPLPGGTGLSLEYSTWFELPSRTWYASLDVIFGAAKVDGTAGVLFKSQ